MAANDLIKQALQAGAHSVGTVSQFAPQIQSVTAGPESYTPTQGGEGLTEAAFNNALQKLIAASGGKVSVFSGKRSTERQAQLWQQALKKYGDSKIARKWVAPPGHSKHEIGIAADLKFADDATKQWVHNNAKRFGIHFPLSNEDWHAELIGSR